MTALLVSLTSLSWIILLVFRLNIVSASCRSFSDSLSDVVVRKELLDSAPTHTNEISYYWFSSENYCDPVVSTHDPMLALYGQIVFQYQLSSHCEEKIVNT